MFPVSRNWLIDNLIVSRREWGQVACWLPTNGIAREPQYKMATIRRVGKICQLYHRDHQIIKGQLVGGIRNWARGAPLGVYIVLPNTYCVSTIKLCETQAGR